MWQRVQKYRHWIQRPRIILIAGVAVALSAFGYYFVGGSKADLSTIPVQTIPSVQTSVVGDIVSDSALEVSGLVTAQTEIDIVALGGGTVRQLPVQVGQQILAGSIVAQLYDATVLTGVANALTGVQNVQLTVDTNARLAQESVRQAEIGLANAQESVAAAETALGQAQYTYEVTMQLQAEELEQLYVQATTVAQNFLNTTNAALSQVNYIIKAEGVSQLPNIEQTLGARDILSVQHATDNYLLARNQYNHLRNSSVLQEATIVQTLPSFQAHIETTIAAVDFTIAALEATVATNQLPDSVLNAQKSAFATTRSQLGQALSSIQSFGQQFVTVPLAHSQKQDALQRAIDTAENQLRRAQLGEQTATAGLSQATLAQQQQSQSIKSALDSAQGQLNIAQNQVNDLSVTSPISGIVTAVFVEVGTQVAPGHMIATVAQNDLVTIEFSVTSEDVYRITPGQSVKIAGEYDGIVSRINPSADPATRTVGVEVVYDNTAHDLVTGTFVDVVIPLAVTEVDTIPLLPLRSVTITQTERYVFVVQENMIVHKQAVTIGNIVGDTIQITSGLELTDQVVIDGARGLKDGQEVKVVNNQ